MVDRGVEGVGFVFTAPSADASAVTAVQRAGARAALLLPADEIVPENVIALDNKAGLRQVVDHLWALGHRHFGFATNARVTVLGPSELESLREAVAARGGVLSADDIVEDPMREQSDDWGEIESGRRAGLALLSRQDRPTAICAVNDLLAVGVLLAARDLGIAVPSELSIVGYAALNLTRVTSPAITSVRHPLYRMGELLASFLIEGHTGEGVRIIPTLEVRESTAEAPSGGYGIVAADVPSKIPLDDQVRLSGCLRTPASNRRPPQRREANDSDERRHHAARDRLGPSARP